MKRPLAAVVSFYVAGLFVAEFFQPPLVWLFASAFFLLTLAAVTESLRRTLIWPLLFFAGWTNLVFHTTSLSPNDLRVVAGDHPTIATLRGVLVETPKIKITGRDDEAVERSIAQVRVETISCDGNWHPAFGTVSATTSAPLPECFFAGQPVEITGVIMPPPLPIAPGLFDNRAYLADRGIYYEFKVSSTNDWRLLEPAQSKAPLTDRFLGWSRRTLAIGLPEDESLRLLWAMTLDWRTAFTGDIGDPFLRAGTMHLFAIDGLRIALISGILVALLRVLQLSRAWCGLIAVPAIWFYTAATGWESSAVRASVMMTVILGGWAIKRPSDLVNSLAAAAFLILLWDPSQLFEASFQLSFFVMLTIGLLLPRMNEFTDHLFQHDPLLPDDLVPKWRRAATRLFRIFARYFSLSLAAWIGSIPLSGMYFHLVSPISPFSNLIAIPLGTLALMANLGALICGTWFAWATDLFNNAAWFFMNAMTDVSVWSTKIPGSYFYVPSPSWISVLLYYTVLAVALTVQWNTARRKIIGAATLILITAAYGWGWERSAHETEVTVLPLNGGHCVFVDAPGRGKDWVIDCGNERAVDSTLKPFLRGQGVNTIPRLALTEGTAMNCGGAKLADDLFGVGELWTSPIHFRSSVYNEIVAGFEKSHHPHKFFHDGDDDGCWTVLWPDTNHFTRADDSALVLCGDFSGSKILLLSDLGRNGQSELLSRTNGLRADIVVSGLPTEGEPLSDPLLDAIQPKVIVIVDSEYPATRRASQALKDRLAQKNVPVVYTRESGAATIVVDNEGWKIRAMDGKTVVSRKDR
ncbi:MAG TPA: ComEC/Rec2 family competence protein [Desulfuromonadaceae bacterium]|nr:ComEC/Rec2 family competence protein [Desulfuromonadaceae bacterium]